MFIDFKGFNSVIYSILYIVELCEKEENVFVNWCYFYYVFLILKFFNVWKGCGIISFLYLGMLISMNFFISY